MATKKAVLKTRKSNIDRDVAKKLSGKKEETKTKAKETRYVRSDNVDRFKKEGWKVVSENNNTKERTLGVKNYTASDLVLMGK